MPRDSNVVEGSGSSTITVQAAPPPGSGVVFVGAGDIANCSTTTDEATAKLLDGIAGTVFTAGDNVYTNGTATEFATCYEPTWGRHKARTRPAPGNHDYNTSGAAPYYAYFGANANVGFVPQVWRTGLSASPAPVGTLACGAFGIDRRS